MRMREWYALVWGTVIQRVSEWMVGRLLARMEKTHVFAAGRLAAGRSW
jgi:hypothetical protein